MSEKEKEIKKIRVCCRCKCKVTKSKIKQYSFECPFCDEDLYAFETELVYPRRFMPFKETK